MAEPRLDRRVGRTRRRLKEALLALIEERGYNAITIGDITQRADVGRSTFYSHYTSKEDLLFSGFDQWLRSLAATPPSGSRAGDRFRFSLPLLHHIRQQKRFFQASIVQGSDVRIRQRTTAMLVELVRLELARAAGTSTSDPVATRERDARAHCVVGAFLGLVTWWLEPGRAFDIEGINRVFHEVVAPPR